LAASNISGKKFNFSFLALLNAFSIALKSKSKPTTVFTPFLIHSLLYSPVLHPKSIKVSGLCFLIKFSTISSLDFFCFKK